MVGSIALRGFGPRWAGGGGRVFRNIRGGRPEGLGTLLGGIRSLGPSRGGEGRVGAGAGQRPGRFLPHGGRGAALKLEGGPAWGGGANHRALGPPSPPPQLILFIPAGQHKA